MKYLLDTNTCIRYLNGRSPQVFKRLSELSDGDTAVCSVVKFELHFGAMRSQTVQKTLAQQDIFLNRFVSLPFDDEAQLEAAQIRADLANVGTPIGPYDLLIAGIALSNQLILVTHNIKEFSRIQGLQLEDWEVL